MHYFNSLQQNTNGNYEFTYRTNIDADRYSIFLYSQVDNSYAANTPTFEDYGCSFPALPNNNNLYTTENPFTGFTKTTEWCPAYNTNKLIPSRINLNNFLVNKIGAINFTCFHAKFKASAFCYNGVVNGESCMGGGALYGSDCYSEKPIRYSGFQNGPRVTLISKDIVISAAHYWYLGAFVPGNFTFTFIGTDNVQYTATAQSYRYGSDDTVIFKVTGLEAAVDAGVIRPIYTINYNTDPHVVNSIPTIMSTLPKFGIDADNMLGLLFESGSKPNNLGNNSIFNFINFNDLIINWGLENTCTYQDLQINPACGDSSSPEFVLFNNNLILFKNRSSAADAYNIWNKQTMDIIDDIIIEMNGSPRNLFTFTAEDLNERRNTFFKFKADDSVILLKPRYEISIIEDTNDGEGKYLPAVEQKGYSVIQNTTGIDQYIFASLYKNLDLKFYQNLSTSFYTFDDVVFSVIPLAGLELSNTQGTVDAFVDDLADTIQNSPCNPNYKLLLTSYDMMLKNNHKFILNSTTYKILKVNIKKLLEKYSYTSNIILSNTKKYYILIPCETESTSINLISELNNFYISTTKNNINTIYSNGIKTFKPINYMEDTISWVISKQTQNIFNIGDLELEDVSQPIDVTANTISRVDSVANCNATGIMTNEKWMYPLILELPANVPDKLYLCFKDHPEYAITIYVEKNTQSMKKDTSLSYLKITPKQNKNESDIIKMTKPFTFNGNILAYYLSCYAEPGFPNLEEPLLPVSEEDLDDIYRNHLNLNAENYSFDATNSLYKSIKNKYEVDPKINFDINLDRE